MSTSKGHRGTKAAKAERRCRREGRRHRDRDHGLRITSFGPVDPLVLRRTVDAFSAVDLGGSWKELGPRVLPLLKRVRHPFPAELAPIHLRVPPGIWAGFGIDVGPAWAHVSRDIIDRWGVDEATLLGTALANLRQRTLDEPPRIERATFVDIPATVIQAQGWGSALILAPDLLAPVLGARPQILLAPVRNALVALPEDVDEDLAVAIWEAFAEGSSDELDVDPLRWTGTGVAALDEDRSTSIVH
jgi:hypothetical protein